MKSYIGTGTIWNRKKRLCKYTCTVSNTWIWVRTLSSTGPKPGKEHLLKYVDRQHRLNNSKGRIFN